MPNWATNITSKPEGSFRSLNGYAAEQAFLARASKAGFNLFFKVWRDLEYDAVLDAEGVLFRIEVKGSSTRTFDLTRGGRSGVQIDRNVNKTRPINREDCDFVVCIDNNDFSCYIVPIEVFELLGRKNLPKVYLEKFKEKWILFLGGQIGVDKNTIKKGLGTLENDALDSIFVQLHIPPEELVAPYKIEGTKTKIHVLNTIKLLRIWEHLAN